LVNHVSRACKIANHASRYDVLSRVTAANLGRSRVTQKNPLPPSKKEITTKLLSGTDENNHLTYIVKEHFNNTGNKKEDTESIDQY